MNEINLTHKKLSRSVLRRLGTLVLALCTALSLLPAVIPPADAAFSDAAMDKLLNWGVVSGYPDGALHPDWSLTRAEFVAMVNRAYGYDELGGTPFIDVPAGAWFRDDVDIGYNANYFTGVSPRMAAPDQQLTREQAVVLLARNMRLQPIDGEVTEFTDGRDFSEWSRGYVRAAKAAGVIGGYSNGTYKPKNNITRGEMAVMLQRALGTLINKPGTHTLSDVYGNVTISSPNVVLTDSTIAGDLYITGGLSLGDVTLQNVRVLGNIIIAGGGESESGESVILRNVQANSLIVDSIAGQYLSLAAEGDTSIREAILRTSSYVQDRTRPGEGLLQITLDSLEATPVFTLSGNLETVVNKTPNSTLNVAMGTVATLNIDEKARSSTLNLDINSTVETLNIDTAATVTGVGDIGDLFVNAPGASVEMLPDTVTIRPGLTADIAGQTMNAQQAQESSADPRLLASYPKVRNVAPTNATSVYSANKGGTVYWALSNTTDGSIGEEELIEPTTENTRITLSGTTTIEQSNTEYTAALEKLTPDTNYYLSTVMTDAHGRHSPVKVASFATPDNTVPAFATGYPTVMRNYCVSLPFRDDDGNLVPGAIQRDEDGYPVRNYRVQIAAMPTKSCVLYYALYPSGSTAPTAQQFRTGALGSPIRSGMEDASKNRINFIELTGLDELTNYDIYLCYIDADGSRSSAVRKLTFRTVDGKPPRFQYETPVVTLEQLTSLRLNVNVNEAATVYWVATKDPYYIKDKDTWNQTEWWENACRQIESGTNGIRSGSANVRANVDSVINITGLQPATRYYIYFVAKDAAGNYSEFFIDTEKNPGRMPDRFPTHPEQYTPSNQAPYKYFLVASTLDNIPPTAEQEFSSYDAADPNRPYADTDITIRFSEMVMQYSANRGAAQDDIQDLHMLYTALVDARTAYEAAENDDGTLKRAFEAAETRFCNTLRATIKLHNNAMSANETVPERTRDNAEIVGDDWVIDYRWAEVEYDSDSGEMTVRFPTNSDDLSRSALNLASGATYHFVLEDISDTSSNKNRIADYGSEPPRPASRTSLPNFTTISAQVQLRRINVTEVSYDCPEDGLETGIPIDFAFSMEPLSTSVESDVDWDIIFWSDTAIEFEVYELDSGDNKTTATAIRPLDKDGHFPQDVGHYKHAITFSKANIEPPDPDTTADNYLGYRGQGYFYNFYGAYPFPSVTGKGNTLADYDVDADVNLRGVMQRGETKYYGVRFKSIENTSEDDGRGKIWDATVNFRVSVVTGSSSLLRNLSIRSVTNETITAHDAEADGSIIHTPRPFGRPAVEFSNTVAPEFDTTYGYPSFDTKSRDTSAKVWLQLDRPGTIYCVVGPASMWNAEHTQETYSPPFTTNVYDPSSESGKAALHPYDDSERTDPTFGRYYTELNGDEVMVPQRGSDATVPIYNELTGWTTEKTSKLELSDPTNNLIFDAEGRYPPDVKTYIFENSGTLESYDFTGLTPDTTYLVYFVTQGQGQIFSERAQLFQFRTDILQSPKLRVTGSTSTSAFITSSKDAYVETTLFRADALDDFFKQTFFDGSNAQYLNPDPTLIAQYTAMLEQTGDQGKKYKEYTVLDAILDQNAKWSTNNFGCMFDYFANEFAKDTAAARIRAQGSDVGLFNNRSLAADDEQRFAYTLDGIMNYVLLAVARVDGNENRNASGHALGFGGRRPLHNVDESKPTISSISVTSPILVNYQDMTVPVSDRPILTGSIRITFDSALHLYNPDTDERTSLTVGQFIDDPNDDSPFTATTLSTDRRTVTVSFTTGVKNGSSFQVNSLLCTENGSPRGGAMLEIRLRYDLSTDTLYAEVVENRVDWFPQLGYTTLNHTVRRPAADSFRIMPSSLGSMNAGQIVNIYAVLLSQGVEGAEGRVYFSANSTAVSVDDHGDNTATITANPVTADTEVTITGELYLSTGGTFKASITVLVKKSYVGSIRTPDSTNVHVSASGGGVESVYVYVDGAENLTEIERRLSKAEFASSTTEVTAQLYPTSGDGSTAYLHITPTKNDNATAKVFMLTVSATSDLITPLTFTVFLDP